MGKVGFTEMVMTEKFCPHVVVSHAHLIVKFCIL